MLLVVFMDRIESNRIYPRDMLLPLLAFSAFVGEVSIHELKDAVWLCRRELCWFSLIVTNFILLLLFDVFFQILTHKVFIV